MPDVENAGCQSGEVDHESESEQKAAVAADSIPAAVALAKPHWLGPRAFGRRALAKLLRPVHHG